ncbi:MAG: UDP-2,3-diacylglucosamine diphosphatase [Fimbriiglobus sp.]
MLDAVVISDLHLGSDNCQARAIVQFLEKILNRTIPTDRLILNGDVFDSIDFRRLKKHHWKVLSLVRKLSDQIEIVWINGNHDGPAEIVSHLLGVEVVEEYTLLSGEERILLLHGHRFDEFIEKYPITSKLADGVYRFLQWLDRSHTIARQAKAQSKTFLRCLEKVQREAMRYASQKGYSIVCCGHTHHPIEVHENTVSYYNSGAWTERPCHYLTILNGRVEIHEFRESAIDIPASETVVETTPHYALA